MEGADFLREKEQIINDEMEIEAEAEAAAEMAFDETESAGFGRVYNRKRTRESNLENVEHAENTFFDDVDSNAVEGIGGAQVVTLENGELPFVPGLETRDDYDDDDDDESHQHGSENIVEFEQDDSDEIASVPLEKWQLGYGFTSVPPSDTRSAVSSDWMPWTAEKQGKLRAVRHMVMQRTLETRDNDQNFCSFKGYSDAAMNERVIALAAVEGLMFDSEAKGMFVDRQGLIEEETLPDDDDKRQKAIRSMPPISAYLYRHFFRQQYDEDGNAVPNAPQHAVEDPGVPRTRQKSYIAPCMSIFVEPIFLKKKPQEGDLDENDPDYDGRGPEVGTRIHKFIFNRRYSVTAYVAKNIEENNQMNRAARAFRAENKWRGKNIGPEKAAKQQRAMVANPDVNWSSGMKFARIQNNYSLVHHLNAASGVDTGGKCRNVYTDMHKSLGSASLNRPMEPHSEFGSLHALSPEWAFNARDGANPPKNLFPEDEFPELPRRPDPENAVGRAFVAFMTAMDGTEVEIDPRQTNPNNYMDDDGCIVFPYPETVQMLCNCLVPLRDATLPLVLSLGAPIGDNALDAFWTVNKRTDAIIEAEVAALNDATSRKMMSLSLNTKDEAQFLRIRDELKRQGRPSFADMKGRLMHHFDSKMRPDQETASVKRMKASRMVMRDSLDPTPAELSTPGGFNEEEITTRRVKLATEETANAIRAVTHMIDEAYAIKLSSTDEEVRKAAVDWFPDAKRESIDWGLRMMRSTYENPKNINLVYPVARGIWKSTFKMVSRLPSVFKNATVDEKDPRRKNGSINLAFGFNKTKTFSGLTPYGNYMRLLTKVYSQILGIQGRVLAGRWALHYASLAPIGPPGFKPMLMRNGIRGLNKSGECIAFQYLFNSSWNPDVECQWWQMTGEGSAQSLRAGGISGTSGGVAWSDEALRSISTGGVTNDPQATEKMQDLKILCTQGFLSRPRTYKVTSATGPGGSLVESFRCINDITLDSTQRVMACNTGCNAAYRPKSGPPPRPDADRRALIDRCVSVPATEGALHECMTDAQFKASVKGATELVWTHNLMTRLTYMIFDCVCLIPEWQATNEKAASDAWKMLDLYMNHNFDIPIPEPRRQTQRRNIGIIKSIERALASYLLYKEEAVAFSEMLPISKPFEQNDDPSKCVHTLAPFDIGQLVNVISTLVYDQEVIIDTFSLSFDSNMWTTNELHHILVELSARHGVMPPTDRFMKCGMTETSTLPNGGVLCEPRDDRVSTQVAPPSDSDTANEETVPTDSAPDGICLPPIKFLYKSTSENAHTQPVLNTCQRFFDRRRKILMEFIRKSEALNVTVAGGYEKNKVSSKVETVMFTHVETRDGVQVKCCRLDDGTSETLSAVQDMVLITSEEVISCGYTRQDVSNWLKGQESDSTFSPQEGETVFLGVKTNSWTFKRRSDVERSTEHVYDPAWRTTGVGPALVTGTPVGTIDGVDPPPADAPPHAAVGHRVQHRSTGPPESKADSHIWKESQSIAENLRIFNLDAAQIFDRLVQIIDSTKENFRRIQLSSPEVKRDTLCIRELDNANSTNMRRFPEHFQKNLVAEMDDRSLADALGAESMIKAGVMTQKVIPFSAVSFGNSSRLHKSRRERSWIKFDDGDDANGLVQLVKPDDICQRRLDALIDIQALPAAVPLMSTTVALDCPLKVFGDSLYCNSGFAINVMRLEYEITQFFKTVPGLRLQKVGNDSNDTTTTGDESSCRASGRAYDRCESVPSPSSDDAPKSSNTIPISILKCAKDIVDDGRASVTPLDVDTCIHSLRYETKPGENMKMFDKLPIFYTLKVHELFNHCDPILCKHIMNKFPDVFGCIEQIESALPETTTRFFENEHEKVVDKMLKSNINLSNKLLSTTKRFEFSSTDRSVKRTRREFTDHELAKIRATHREETGLDVKDLEKLRSIASKSTSSTRAESTSACNRAEWRQNAVETKVKSGMIHPRGALKTVIADVGTGMLTKVREYYAVHTESVCPDPILKKGIEYLRPFNASTNKGTCSETERDVVEIALINSVSLLRPEERHESEIEANARESPIDDENAFDTDACHAAA